MNRMFAALIAGLTNLIPSAAIAGCFGSQNLPSPDGMLTARITQIGHQACGESRVQIFDRAGHMLAYRDFTSKDGQNGAVAQHVAWSVDSHFLAVSLFSSGGHQAEHFPLLVYSSVGSRLYNLEDMRAGLFVSNPDFHFQGDKIELSDLNKGRTVIDLAHL